jgi:hypothetical protein
VLTIPGPATTHVSIIWQVERGKELPIAHAEDERLRTISGPLRLLVEGRGIPDNLEHQLWKFHGVG